MIDRLIAAGERNPRIRIRKVDKSKFDDEARIILNLLNDAWSNNWGYVPLTTGRDRLRRQEIEADHLQRTRPHRRVSTASRSRS